MAIEIVVRQTDGPGGQLLWESKITHFSEYLFQYPEYRKAVFEQAGRLLDRKLCEQLKGIPDE